jgi:CubicO group peptidase (beta-lactamase class C family)
MLTFHTMDQLFQTRPVPRSGPIAALPRVDQALPDAVLGTTKMTEDQWEDRTFTNALLVMRDGKIVHESYRNNTDASTHYISFSMAKSITSIMVGIAVNQGFIKSIDQPATDYVPELKGRAMTG